MRALFDVEDCVVVIAGAAGAFGSVIAGELASRGCRLSLLDIDAAELENVAAELSKLCEVHRIEFDATIEEQCKSVFSECTDYWGRIDAFVNCVGAFEIIPAQEMSQEVFAHVVDTNLTAAMSMCRYAAKHMIPNRSGRIVNISSVSDSVANPGYAAYAASKSALTHLTRVLAVELAPYSITVNAISPAICETNLTSDFLSQGNNRAEAKSKILLNRFLEPEDILGTVILLISAGGSFITGQAIHVDGGRTIT